MTEVGDNLSSLMSVVPAMLGAGGSDRLASLLDEHVVWQGLAPELVCQGRDEVLGFLGRPRTLRLKRIEAEEFGDRVVVSVDGPGLPETPMLAAGAARSLVFTFRDHKVVRIESVASRDAAFRLAAG